MNKIIVSGKCVKGGDNGIRQLASNSYANSFYPEDGILIKTDFNGVKNLVYIRDSDLDKIFKNETKFVELVGWKTERSIANDEEE
jgi:hypothetical protein